MISFPYTLQTSAFHAKVYLDKDSECKMAFTTVINQLLTF